MCAEDMTPKPGSPRPVLCGAARRSPGVLLSHPPIWERPASESRLSQLDGGSASISCLLISARIPPLPMLSMEPIGMATCLRPRQVAFLEEHVGHVSTRGANDQTLDLAHLTVGGMDGFASADSHFTGRSTSCVTTPLA